MTYRNENLNIYDILPRETFNLIRLRLVHRVSK